MEGNLMQMFGRAGQGGAGERDSPVCLQNAARRGAHVHRLEEFGDVCVDSILQVPSPPGVSIDEGPQVVRAAPHDPPPTHRSGGPRARAVERGGGDRMARRAGEHARVGWVGGGGGGEGEE